MPGSLERGVWQRDCDRCKLCMAFLSVPFFLGALFSFDFLIWLDRRIILCDAHCFMMAMLIYLSIFFLFLFPL